MRPVIAAAVSVALLAGGGIWLAGHDSSGSTDATAGPQPIPGAHDSPLPTFSDSTQISNPLFPLSSTSTLSYAGEKNGKPYRVTVTLTDRTKSFTVDGKRVTAVVAKHRGTIEGDLIEVAYDYFAQADDGGVWYMGENVDNYEGGRIANHEGTWLAGVDGARPGLLVPGDPQPGLVYYSEDIPDQDIVERDKVLSVDRTVELPNGETAHNVVKIKAFKEDGTTETKLYVPGIGMFEERTPDDYVRLVATRA